MGEIRPYICTNDARAAVEWYVGSMGAEVTYDRGYSASGVVRQMMAILTQPDRTAALRTLTIPATVVHGTADRLVNPSGGRATADAIPGAELRMVEGMAHDLPPQLWDTLIAAITDTIARTSTGR